MEEIKKCVKKGCDRLRAHQGKSSHCRRCINHNYSKSKKKRKAKLLLASAPYAG